MIKNITFAVTFPTNGVKLSGDFQPQPGITAVTGRNGSGKTFSTIEVTRYLLFGSKALRGESSDYKTLDAQGQFIIRGKEYDIARGPKRQSVRLDNEVVAVGADAVNKYLVEAMGYGLGVFDVCNASVQGDAGNFGKMKPVERKRMIDQVVGLTGYENIEKACRTEANRHKTIAQTLTGNLVHPVEPVRTIQGTAAGAKAILEQLDMVARKAEMLRNRVVQVVEPQIPASPRPTPKELETLHIEVAQRGVAQERERRLRRKIAEGVPNYDAQQLDDAEDWLDFRNELERWEALKAKTVECPACHNEFFPNNGEHLNAKPTPAYPVGAPLLSATQIREGRDALIRHEGVKEAKAELATLVIPADRAYELQVARQSAQDWQRYDADHSRYLRQLEDNQQARDDLAFLGFVPSADELEAKAEEVIQLRLYEAAVARYDDDKALFAANTLKIVEEQRLADEFVKGATNLSDARTMLKNALAPTLSAIASRVIADATHGELSSVEVDEDMEIKVNNQKLHTLSGAGATVANIALRIALGEILTTGTFPVFLGDEMDSDADSIRREATAEALAALMQNPAHHLQQIILVTHRDVSIAEHTLKL